MTTPYIPPEWAFEFHGHQCPFMPIGYRMSRLAMNQLGVEREPDHGFFVFPELGEAHPQTCLMDGIQVATGATYGKVLISKTFYGKLAATFYHPQQGAVRLAIKPDFIDALGRIRVFRLPQARRASLPRFPRRCAMKSFTGSTRKATTTCLRWNPGPTFGSCRPKARSIKPSVVSVASMCLTAICE